jgi:dipeptidyl aminopeptidase/acylaminoacyl peptidase
MLALLAVALHSLGDGVEAQQAPAALLRDALAAPDPLVVATLPAYLTGRAASFVDWLADGGMLIATRFGDSEQIHRLHAPLAMREQMSFASDGVLAAAARPYASDAMVYLQRHGEAGTALLLQPLAAAAPTALTDGSHRDGPPRWAHDGRLIAFASDRRNGADVDIYLLDTAAPATAPRLLVGGSGARWRVYDWSIDDKRLLLGREATAANDSPADHSPAECELYVADVASGELTAVAPAPAGSGGRSQRAAAVRTPIPARAWSAQFATDGHGIVLLGSHPAPGGGGDAAAAAQFVHLSYTDQSGREWRDLSLAGAHDVEHFDQSIDGRYLAYTIDDGGISRLMLLDQQRKLDLTVSELPAGIISGLKFDASGKHLALTLETSRSPRDVYEFDPDTHLLTRWTHSEVGPLEMQSLATPQLLHFPTWDRVDGQARELSGLVYWPAAPAAPAASATTPTTPAAPAAAAAAAAAAASRPVLILLCASAAQCRPGFQPFVQYLVNQLGLVVLVPGVRGSPGFGRAYQEPAQAALRDDAVRDVGSLLVWIGLQHELDRNRIAVLGEGSGSYLALASLAQYGDRLLGGVVAFPVHFAPFANVAAIRRPVLLVQGLNNPAVPAYELEQLRSRLRVNGVDAPYLAAADEGQLFEHGANRAAYLEAAASFLARLLR